MGLRATLFSRDTREDLRELAAFASLPANLYEPARHRQVPGDDERFVRRIISVGSAGFAPIRVVFTVTLTPSDGRYRHLSVSCPERDFWPHPSMLFTIATLLGFTGGETVNDITVRPGPDWICAPHSTGDSYVVAQRLP